MKKNRGKKLNPPPRAGFGHVEGAKHNKGNNHNVTLNLFDCFCRNLLISCKMSGFPQGLHCNEIPNQVRNDAKCAGLGHIIGVKGNDNGRVRRSDAPNASECKTSAGKVCKLRFCHPVAYRKPSPLLPFGHPLPAGEGNKSAAFTLSEVLITLVIIGIVAAITVPNIVAHQREVATVEKVKKFYSNMNNAIKLAITNTGLKPDEWEFDVGNSHDNDKKFWSFFKPYFTVISDDCGTTKECYSSINSYHLSGSRWGNFYASSYYRVILNDGSLIAVTTNWGNQGCTTTIDGVRRVCGVIYYDVNGTKKPNTIGKDIFLFYFTPDGLKFSSLNDCKSDGKGFSCSKLVLKNGNMDYLH